jgi:4'-phosphopantetheinyl transferase EntD
MRDLLPDSVAVAVAGDADWSGPLLPAELGCLSDQAVPARRRDFTAGRVCARRALAGLGITGRAVPAAADRAPVWPAGTVGSITHTSGYCAAAVARSVEVRSLGIDAERHLVLDPGVRELVCLPAELDWCAGQDGEVSWPAVFFSAKEAVYKLWHPLVGTWLDFHDVRLELDPAAGTFVGYVAPARVRAAPDLAGAVPSVIAGRFAVDAHLVRTVAVLPR